jgi:hypothetical protein
MKPENHFMSVFQVQYRRGTTDLKAVWRTETAVTWRHWKSIYWPIAELRITAGSSSTMWVTHSSLTLTALAVKLYHNTGPGKYSSCRNVYRTRFIPWCTPHSNPDALSPEMVHKNNMEMGPTIYHKTFMGYLQKCIEWSHDWETVVVYLSDACFILKNRCGISHEGVSKSFRTES